MEVMNTMGKSAGSLRETKLEKTVWGKPDFRWGCKNPINIRKQTPEAEAAGADELSLTGNLKVKNAPFRKEHSVCSKGEFTTKARRGTSGSTWTPKPVSIEVLDLKGPGRGKLTISGVFIYLRGSRRSFGKIKEFLSHCLRTGERVDSCCLSLMAAAVSN